MQVIKVFEIREHLPDGKNSPLFTKALEWVGHWPTALDVSLRRRLLAAICKSCEVTEAEIYAILAGVAFQGNGRKIWYSQEDKLRDVLPKGGWFERYDQYTRKTESPLSFHIFSSLCVLGAALGRRVYKRMGFFNVYPNYCVVLIGPTGRVKKTSACDIAKGLIHAAALCPIMADKITPESLATTLARSGHHFIYAPEFSVLFGKQRYNEGLTTQIIRLLDCPESFSVSTQARGTETVTNVALTVLGGTTASLLSSSTPDEVTSSGFLNRFMLVVENDTERCFDVPEKGEGVEAGLLETAKRLVGYSGEMDFDSQGRNWYSNWYRERWKLLRATADETQVEVMERTPVHLIRTAMLIHLVQCDNLAICVNCLEVAKSLVDYAEKAIPETLLGLKQVSTSQDAEYVIHMLQKLGGAADHSTLLRRVASKMDTGKLKQHVKTLEESGRLTVGRKGSAIYYVLPKEEE